MQNIDYDLCVIVDIEDVNVSLARILKDFCLRFNISEEIESFLFEEIRGYVYRSIHQLSIDDGFEFTLPLSNWTDDQRIFLEEYLNHYVYNHLKQHIHETGLIDFSGVDSQIYISSIAQIAMSYYLTLIERIDRQTISLVCSDPNIPGIFRAWVLALQNVLDQSLFDQSLTLEELDRRKEQAQRLTIEQCEIIENLPNRLKHEIMVCYEVRR